MTVRRWHRPSVLALAAMAIVGAQMAYFALWTPFEKSSLTEPREQGCFGWPFIYAARLRAGTIVDHEVYVLGLVANVICWYVVVRSTVIVCSSQLNRANLNQVSLRGLLSAVAVIAALMAIGLVSRDVPHGDVAFIPALDYLHHPIVFENNELVILRELRPLRISDWSAFEPWYFRLPVLFGIGCVIFRAGSFLARLVREVWIRPRHEKRR